MSLLAVDKLSVRYGATKVVDELSFAIDVGEAVGLVGESGSGKTQTAHAIMGLLPASASVEGSVRLGDDDLLALPERSMRAVRGRRIAMVFQDPMLALNPYLRIGAQLAGILDAHGIGGNSEERKRRVVAALARVGLPDPERQYASYPHELSGGMRQRALIASALLGEPELLIADEPTTALDVTVQAEVLDLVDQLREETALLLITHDLGVVAGHCERMLVLDQGRLVESGATAGVFREPESRAMQVMLDAAPSLAAPALEATGRGDRKMLLSGEGLEVRYSVRRGSLDAVRNASLEIRAGETLAVVGESGSGKSSLARAVLGLVPAAAGKVVLGGRELATNLAARPAAERRELSLVFQDPVGSLCPSMTVGEIVAEPLRVQKQAMNLALRRERVLELLASVGIEASLHGRYPHELSGGQAQRVAIARALALEPKVLVCDEAVAALDGSVRQRILDLLSRIQEETGLAILFIAHDLAVVKDIAHHVAVMYLGRIVEYGPTATVFAEPGHPYTRALLDAVPLPDPMAPGGVATLSGELPSPMAPPSGCAFRTRCHYAEAVCGEAVPQLEHHHGQRVACVRASELDIGRAT